jgi:hypothetical protein
MFRRTSLAATALITVLAGGIALSDGATAAPTPQLTRVSNPRHDSVAAHLKTFNEYDFKVFNKQNWRQVAKSHATNVTVYNPDGTVTHGLKAHLPGLQSYFVYAPDARISRHVYAFGQGNLTSVSGVFQGTFTKPMPDGKGGFIKPTGKAFKVQISTVAKWKHGKIVEKRVYLDVHTFLVQLGLA